MPRKVRLLYSQVYLEEISKNCEPREHNYGDIDGPPHSERNGDFVRDRRGSEVARTAAAVGHPVGKARRV